MECKQCRKDDDLFGKGVNLCYECMSVEGLCLSCGNYIPFPESDDDEAWELNDCGTDANFVATLCKECK